MQLCTVFVMLQVNSKFPNRITTAITNIAVIHDQKREKEEIALYCLLIVRYCTKKCKQKKQIALYCLLDTAPTDSFCPNRLTDFFFTNRLLLHQQTPSVSISTNKTCSIFTEVNNLFIVYSIIICHMIAFNGISHFKISVFRG